MLTKRQKWRRVRVVRSISVDSGCGGSISRSGSGSDGDVFAGFPMFATAGEGSVRKSSQSDTAAMAPAAAVPQDSESTSTTPCPPAPPPPPPPRPPPQQQATPPPPPPHQIEPDHAAQAAAECSEQQTTPAAVEQRHEQQQHQQHQHEDQYQHHQSRNHVFASAPPATHHRNPLDAWKMSALNILKLLFLFDASGAGGNGDGSRTHHSLRGRASTEGYNAFGAAAAARPRRPSEPACRPPPPPQARVRFSHQIRVILVASRVEMLPVKADVWWGQQDYISFRRAYLTAAREERETHRALERQRRAAAQVLPQEGESKTPLESESNNPVSAPSTMVATAATAPESAGKRSGKLAPSAAPCRGGKDGDAAGDLPRSCGDSSSSGGPDCGRGDKLVSPAQEGPLGPPPPPFPPFHDDEEYRPPAAQHGGDAGNGAAEAESLLPDGGPALAAAATSADGSVAAVEELAPAAGGGEKHASNGEGAAERPAETAECAAASSSLPKVLKKPVGTVESVVVARGLPGLSPCASMVETSATAAGEVEARRLAGNPAELVAARTSPRANGGGEAGGGVDVGNDRSGAGGKTWLPSMKEPAAMLETEMDLRLDPRTGGRIPLQFLGDAPIRRVASF